MFFFSVCFNILYQNARNIKTFYFLKRTDFNKMHIGDIISSSYEPNGGI
jgi:hypothetical protein